MLIRKLDVIIRKRHGKIVAVARQEMEDGPREGSNILKKKRPSTFDEAKALVRLEFGDSVQEINFITEQKDWERPL